MKLLNVQKEEERSGLGEEEKKNLSNKEQRKKICYFQMGLKYYSGLTKAFTQALHRTMICMMVSIHCRIQGAHDKGYLLIVTIPHFIMWQV